MNKNGKDSNANLNDDLGMEFDYAYETKYDSDDNDVKDRNRVESNVCHKRIGELTADDI